MARTYREIAIEDMVLTVEEAISRVIDWRGDPAAVDERSDRAVSDRTWGYGDTLLNPHMHSRTVGIASCVSW